MQRLAKETKGTGSPTAGNRTSHSDDSRRPLKTARTNERIAGTNLKEIARAAAASSDERAGMLPLIDNSSWSDEQGALIISNTVCLGIQKDVDQCGSLALRKTMIDNLWDIFNVKTTGIPTHTICQISVIMRFLEIQWQKLGEEIRRDA